MWKTDLWERGTESTETRANMLATCFELVFFREGEFSCFDDVDKGWRFVIFFHYIEFMTVCKSV